MEVHAHTHTPRKKWSHYFWEFLMLFLAVFCGFLAENFREHQIEHQREKQFMRSLTEDLQTDIKALKIALVKCDSAALYSDSALIFFSNYQLSTTVPVKLTKYIGTAGQRLSLNNTDRTSSQLKNSGAMRLIRKKNVSDSILYYWKQIGETVISLDRYMVYRDAGRSLTFKLWVIPEVYRKGMGMHPDSIKMLKVIDNDPKKWDELTNLLAISGSIARTPHFNNLKKQWKMAENLIALIRKEYHLK